MTTGEQDPDETEKLRLVARYLDIASELRLSSEDPFRTGYPPSHRQRLLEYPLEFLRDIEDAMEAGGLTAVGLTIQTGLGPKRRPADSVLDALHYHRLLGGTEYLQSYFLTDSLGHYEATFPLTRPYRDAAPELEQQYLALLRFVGAFLHRDEEEVGDWLADFPEDALTFDGKHEMGIYSYHISEAAMVRLVAENPHRTGEITGIIKERGVTDAGQIAALLEAAPVSILARGAL